MQSRTSAVFMHLESVKSSAISHVSLSAHKTLFGCSLARYVWFHICYSRTRCGRFDVIPAPRRQEWSGSWLLSGRLFAERAGELRCVNTDKSPRFKLVNQWRSDRLLPTAAVLYIPTAIRLYTRIVVPSYSTVVVHGLRRPCRS